MHALIDGKQKAFAEKPFCRMLSSIKITAVELYSQYLQRQKQGAWNLRILVCLPAYQPFKEGK